MTGPRAGLALVSALLLGGCAADEDAALTAEAAGYPTFYRCNLRQFATAQHQGNPLVDVWANDLAIAAYRAVSSDAPTPIVFPIGAMVVKEMLAADGGEPLLTVMAKRAPGYAPAHGDWWFGRLRADGSATRADFVGRVGFCIACHDGAAATDHVFGVAVDNLAPPP